MARGNYTLEGAKALCRGAIKSGKSGIYDKSVEYIDNLTKRQLEKLIIYLNGKLSKEKLMDLVAFIVLDRIDWRKISPDF